MTRRNTSNERKKLTLKLALAKDIPGRTLL